MSLSAEDFNLSALVEISEILGNNLIKLNTIYWLIIYYILGLVGKNWSIFRVSPLWNLHFNRKYLNRLSKDLSNFLIKHITSNMKQNNLSSQISVQIEAKEARDDYIALKVIVFYICKIFLFCYVLIDIIKCMQFYFLYIFYAMII